ncbi:MAG: 30S ribosomal protein S5 [Halobacteriota archaeon]|nr:30S ribosomal protein S5 [Halobacteriota archaeon]
MVQEYEEDWIPKTRLGRMVTEDKITTIEEALESGMALREYQIVDLLVPELRDEILDINMVQRMTDSGRRVKFRVVVAVGNEDGFVGVGQARDAQVGPAIKKAINDAKLNLINVKRGCGSWECDCEHGHSIPFEVTGKCGSVQVTLKPAPMGLGLACGETAKKVLELGGIKDIWAKSKGRTRTTLNFAKATFDALKMTTAVKLPPQAK